MQGYRKIYDGARYKARSFHDKELHRIFGDDAIYIDYQMAHKGIDHTDLIGWQQYYLPAKVFVLELRNKKLEEENLRLSTLTAASEEALLKELPKYAQQFKERETQYIRNVIACRYKIDYYRDFLYHQRVYGVKQDDCETNFRFFRKMAKDAIRFYESRLKIMLKEVYSDIPERITSLPISTINEMCGTDLSKPQ